MTDFQINRKAESCILMGDEMLRIVSDPTATHITRFERRRNLEQGKMEFVAVNSLTVPAEFVSSLVMELSRLPDWELLE